MKKLVLSVLVVLGAFSSAAHAADFGIEVGVRSQSGDADGTGLSTSSQTAAQVGAIAHFPISGGWHFRTGLLYTQRPLIVKSGGVEAKVSMNYVDVPLALMYKFEDYAGVFAGVSMGMNMDKSCDTAGCTMSDVKSPILPFLVGASFKFAPNLGATVYFESYGDTVAKLNGQDLKNYRAVGANLLITFD